MICSDGGMVYTQHLKCCGLTAMWVQLPLRARTKKTQIYLRFFVGVEGMADVRNNLSTRHPRPAGNSHSECKTKNPKGFFKFKKKVYTVSS